MSALPEKKVKLSEEVDDIVMDSSTATTTEADNAADGKQKRLDLCFALDVTGSMQSYIDAARENVRNIMRDIVVAEKCDVRFAMVVYRDHPPQDSTFVTKTLDFGGDMGQVQSFLDELVARGGGDGPEAVGAALLAVKNLSWRADDEEGDVAKVCVFIADAPPHGLGENGDGFAQGPPDGSDAVRASAEVAEAGIVVYSVGCEPSLSRSYQYAADFFASLADRTGGQFLPLASAKLLADVVVGGAQEQLALAELQRSVDAELTAIREERPELREVDDDDERVATELATRLQKKGVQTRQVAVDSPYEVFEQHNVVAMSSAKSLSGLSLRASKKQLRAGIVSKKSAPRGLMMTRMSRRRGVPMASMASAAPPAAPEPMMCMAAPAMRCDAPAAPPVAPVQSVSNSVDSISYGQVSRMMKQRKNKRGY